MPTYTRQISAQLGASRTGLGSSGTGVLGVTITDIDGTVRLARNTGSISEVGTSGWYYKSITWDTAWGDCRATWDDHAATPTFSVSADEPRRAVDVVYAGGQQVTATTGVDLDDLKRIVRALRGNAVSRMGIDNRFGIPFHHNLGVPASMIRWGTANCLWLGDSTGSIVTTPRFRQGIVRAWDVRWSWIYGPCYGTSGAEGANTGNGAPTVYLPGATLPDGSTNDSALNCGVYTFGSNVANPAGFLDFYVDWTNSNPIASGEAPTEYAAGDWTRGKQVKLRILHKKLTSTLGEIRVSGQRFNVGSLYNSTVNLSTTTGHQAVEVDITDPAAAVPTTAATILVGYGQTGSTPVDETGKTFAQNGFMFYLPQVRSGFGMASISEGGWSTSDHLSPTNSGADAAYYDADGKYTQAHIQQMLASLELGQGTINIIFIQIGINSSTGETTADEAASQVYKTNVQKIINRYRAAYDAAGYERPWFVLIPPWLTGEGSATYLYRNLQAKRLYELSRENPQDVAFLNLMGMIVDRHGGYASWESTYLADGTHQNAAGTLEFAKLMWECIVDASSAHAVTRAVDRETRKLLTDATLAPAAIGANSLADRLMNKNSSKTYSASTDSLEAQADAASSGGSGTGARTITITVNDGATVISGATVRLTLGVDTYTATTNGSGVATFNVDDGTWTVAITKPGYTYAGTTIVVDGTETATYSMTAVSITPAAAGQTNAYLTTRDGGGTAKASVTITFQMLAGPGTAGNSFDSKPFTATSNGSGLLQVTLLQLATYVGIRGDGTEIQFTTGSASTYELPEILGQDS